MLPGVALAPLAPARSPSCCLTWDVGSAPSPRVGVSCQGPRGLWVTPPPFPHTVGFPDLAGAGGRGGAGARGACAPGFLGAPGLGGPPAMRPPHPRGGLPPVLCSGHRGSLGGPRAQRVLPSGVPEPLDMSRPPPPGTPASGTSSGLGPRCVPEGEGSVAPAGAEQTRVGVHPAVRPSCCSDLGLGLALPTQLPVFKALIKRDCPGLILSLCLNALLSAPAVGPSGAELRASTQGCQAAHWAAPNPVLMFCCRD